MTTLTDSNIDENQVLLVCFSEIKENKLVGISCQNDTGFHLFSGGLKKGRFELEKVSRFILKIRPITILNYVKLSLFSEYMIINKFNYKIKINKSQKHTVIKDYNKKLNIEIDVL